jgi:hypothetical protein
MNKTCELLDEREVACGQPATSEVRFQEDPTDWVPTCEACLQDRRGNQPMIVIMETRHLPAPGPAPEPKHKCELEGDTDPCGLVATKEVQFSEDFPGEWFKACEECIDRRKEVFKMELREISTK